MALLNLFLSHDSFIQIDMTCFLIILLSLPLVYFDMKSHAYPLLLWVICFVLLFLTATPNLLILGCLILAILTPILHLKMGAGDFLYLSLISFSTSFFQLIYCLFIASSLALLHYLFFIRKKEKELPFLPFLFLAYLLMVYLSHIG